MENFKIDLSKLTPVPEADRVKGSWYVVCHNLRGYGEICQWHSGSHRLHPSNGDAGYNFAHWFAIPPGLPGFPVAELPDELILDHSKFVVCMNFLETRVRRRISLPPISIPSGTKSEQVAELRKILEELER